MSIHHYYILGKLYPQKSKADNVIQSPADDLGNLDSDSEDSISLCNGKNPSSCSISFNIIKDVLSFKINVNAAAYSLINREEAKEILKFEDKEYKEKASFWKRVMVANNFSHRVE